MSGDTLNQWTLFCFVLLGNPALRIPKQQPGTNFSQPVLYPQSPTYWNKFGYPVYHISSGDSIKISSITNSPSAVTKHMNAYTLSTALDSTSFSSSPFDYKFVPKKGPQLFLIRTRGKNSKEGWLYLFTTTGNIVIDGCKNDWERASINPVAKDPQDFEPPEYDLQDLYVTNDADNWYIGFNTVGSDTITRRTYGIAIDCTTGGYTGEQGNDRDGLGNWITFGSTHPVDYEIYLRPVYDSTDALLFKWIEGWEYGPLSMIGGRVQCGGKVSQFIELSLPKDVFGSDSISLIVFSSTLGEENMDPQPAQDAVPSDPATYNTPHWGQSNANTLTKFVTFRKVGIEETTKQKIVSPILFQNRPNPVIKKTIISYFLPYKQHVSIKIYDISGREVKVLVEGKQVAGRHSVIWNPEVSSGIYFCKMTTKEYRKENKIILLR
jgi:hypothetical protein